MRSNLFLMFAVGSLLAGCGSAIPQKRPYYFRPLGNTPDIVEVPSSLAQPSEKTKKSGSSVCFERSPSQAVQQDVRLAPRPVLEPSSRSASIPTVEKTGGDSMPLQNGGRPKEGPVKVKSFLDN